MITRDEKYSNVLVFPSIKSGAGHSADLIIDDYDQWSNLGVRESQAAFCTYRPDTLIDDAA